MAPILGYWDIRGLAEPIRLLLNYTETEFKDERYELSDALEYSSKAWTSVKYTLGLSFSNLAEPIRLLLNYTETDFKDERYELGDAPEYSAKAWTSVKYTLGLSFPNLPYYIDGDMKISQSNAILRHIARKHDLCGTSEEEKVMVDVAENQLMDFRKKFTGLCYNQNFETLKENYLNDVKPIIKQFAEFLGEKKFITGDKITFVDFILYEIMDEHQIFDSTLLEPHKNLKDFLKRIEELPTIAAYLKSDRFKPRPINNKMAKFK